jgi:hypothetical protein
VRQATLPENLFCWRCAYLTITLGRAPVAQRIRAVGFYPMCRRFDSCRVYQITNLPSGRVFNLVFPATIEPDSCEAAGSQFPRCSTARWAEFFLSCRVYQYIDLIERWGFYIGTFATIEPDSCEAAGSQTPRCSTARWVEFFLSCRVYQSISTIK